MVVIPASLSVGVGSSLFIVDWYNNRVRLVSGVVVTTMQQGSNSGQGQGQRTEVTGTITTIAGGGVPAGKGNGDGGPGLVNSQNNINVSLTYPVFLLPQFFFAFHTINTHVLTHCITPATSATLVGPYAVALDNTGNSFQHTPS